VLDFRILGPFEVVEGQRAVALGGPKQRALLAILVLRCGEVVSSDRLIDQLWGERPPATAAKTLQVYVSHLRKALGNEVLLTRGGGYVLAAEPGQVDAVRFEALVTDARHALANGDAAGARELLGSALELWRGEALADLAYEPFAQAEITRLEGARFAALEDRIEADLMRGHHRSLVGELESLVALRPHRERLRGQLMLALYRSGRQAEALEVYRRGRQALDDELGLEPGPELRALEQRILNHDTTLDVPTAAPERSVPVRPVAARRWALPVAAGALLLAAAIAAGVAELTAGPAGGLRVAPNSVAAIDIHTNQVVAQVPVGARPSALTFGSGSLWVANLDDKTVSRVDPGTLLTQRTFSLAAPPTGIAAAAGGIWVVGSSPSATSVSVSRIDPQFDAIGNTVSIGNVVPGSAGAVAANGASLWVAPYSGPLVRLDPQTGRIVTRLDPNAAPSGLALGAGAVWVTDSDADDVSRIDPTGLVTAVAVGHGPSGIAVGEGGVWVADTGDNNIVRIDPSTSSVTTTIPVGAAPMGVAIGAGSVWVANSGDGTVTRIDPKSERVIATIAVGGSPQAITIVRGRAWVTVDARTLPPTGLAAGGGAARLDSYYDVGSMDPALAYGGLSWQLLYATCAKLLNYPDKSGPLGSQLVPEVAKSLPVRSADGKSYTFTIRTGFRFSPPSNAPVTAQTFKATIERSLNPRMRSPVAYEFRDIVGAVAYTAGKAPHIAGVIVRGNTLTIRLVAPAPDLPTRITEPAFCAVPSDTPIDPQGVRVIPSAGPYRVASYTPGQGVVLTRNPNYHGSRPRRLARIEVAVGIPPQRAVTQVEAGSADYAVEGEVDSADAATLAARYGPGSPAARSGRQQYFVNPGPQLDLLALNTHRPLFANERLRRAVNYAIDRTALARLGDEYEPLPEHPTDHYLPPGVPGYSNVRIYPLTPDLAKARQLAKRPASTTAMLYTCDAPPCGQQAQIVKTDLAAIGIRVEVKTFPDATLLAKYITPGEPFDIGWLGWLPDYPDPDAVLNTLLETGAVLPTFNDPTYRARLAAAAALAGVERYLTYAKLDTNLARTAAPFVAFGNQSSHELFSARIGCQVSGVYGMDLAALCIRRTPARKQEPASPR
jgi:YVTN family beta-propeller protein